MHKKTEKMRYAVMGTAAWMLWGSTGICSPSGNGDPFSEHVAAGDVHVAANLEREVLREEPETKTIISREELDRKGARTLSDALAAEQSIQMGTDNMGRKTVGIRGAEARHTLILVDGRRLAGGLSKFYGATDEVSRIALDDVDHVEIIRGSGTSRYGADAIGGVINIVTKMPHAQGVRMTTEGFPTEGGATQYNHHITYATGDLGGGTYAEVSYGQSKTAPFLYDADGSSMQYYGKRRPMGARVEFSLGRGETLRVSADRIDEDLKKDTPLGKLFEMDAIEDAWRENLSIDWKKQTERADYRLRAYRTAYNSDTDFYVSSLPTAYRPMHWGYFDFLNRVDAVIEGEVGIMADDKHYVSVGAAYHDEYGEGTRISVPGQTGAKVSRQYYRLSPIDGESDNATLTHYGVYVMDHWQAGKKLLLTPALRYTNHSHFGVNLSPSMGATFKPRDDVRIKANIGTSFATGGLAELYHDWEMYEPSLNPRAPFRNGWLFEGNPDLKPEKALNMDISVEKDFGKKTSAKLTLFRTTFKDYMQIAYVGEAASKNLRGFTRMDNSIVYPNYDPWYGGMRYDDVIAGLDGLSSPEDRFDFIVDNTQVTSGMPALDDVYTYKNISRALAQGAEAEVTHEVARDFSIKAGYTYLDARDRDTGNRLEGRGRHMINLTLSYNDAKHGWRATFWGDYTKNYLDIRDRVATGRIITADGTSSAGGKVYTVTDRSRGITRDVTVYPTKRDAQDAFNRNVEHSFTREKVAREKNYGMWNFMLEKDLQKTFTLYAGVTNIFDHHDPFLGMGGRVWRFGMRMTF